MNYNNKKKGSTLVLNADCQPLNLLPIEVIPWKVAVEKVWSDAAEVLHFHDDWVVRSPSVTLKVPAVIMLRSYKEPKRRVAFNRDYVFIRDRFTCQYCMERFTYNELTFDHVTPHSHGGKTVWSNISTACRPCNMRRGTNTRIRPHKEPYRPSYWEMVEKAKDYPIAVPHHSWSYYIDWKPELINVRTQ